MATEAEANRTLARYQQMLFENYNLVYVSVVSSDSTPDEYTLEAGVLDMATQLSAEQRLASGAQQADIIELGSGPINGIPKDGRI